MHNITLTCSVITPMFMAGADGRTPEIRPSEFKGMMRWWWRAIKAEDDISKLKENENEIFGGTGNGEGKSKIWIRIKKENNFQTGNNLKSDEKLKWEFNPKTKDLKGEHTGIGYLLYSTVLPRKERGYIKTNSQFSIDLISTDEKNFKVGLASLWLAIYLGGFGSRSRRGAGNIQVINEPTHELVRLEFVIREKDSKGVARWIKDNFNKALEIINSGNIKDFAFSYSNLSFSRFIISKEGKDSWIDALNELGEIYQSFRWRNRAQVFLTAAFGLPVLHNRDKIVNSNVSNRRSSPLIFKVIKSEDKYYWMVLRLFGEFLREGAVLKFQNKTQKPDYSLIDEFWNELKQNGDEYILNIPDKLNSLVEKIRRELNPKRIILYGSRARGDAHRKSDIDIAIETETSIERLEIHSIADVVNLNKVNSNLKKKIQTEGVVLYERKS